MSHVFNNSQQLSPNRTGVRVQDVYDLLIGHGTPMTCKEIGHLLNVDVTIEEHLKDISNRCGYLLQKGLVERVTQGTYRALETGYTPQEGTSMTMTETRPELPPDETEYRCGLCNKPAKSQMGLKAHMTRSHPGFGLSADEAFERTGQALEVLFPNGIPMSRLIELAGLQKEMLKVLTK